MLRSNNRANSGFRTKKKDRENREKTLKVTRSILEEKDITLFKYNKLAYFKKKLYANVIVNSLNYYDSVYIVVILYKDLLKICVIKNFINSNKTT